MQFRKSENTFRGLARKHKIIWNFIFFRFWFILSLFFWLSGFYRATNIIWKDFRKATFIKINVKKTYFILFMSRSTLCDDLPNKAPCYIAYVIYIMWCMYAYIWQWANNRLKTAFYRFYAQNIYQLWLYHMAHWSISDGADVIHMGHIYI